MIDALFWIALLVIGLVAIARVRASFYAWMPAVGAVLAATTWLGWLAGAAAWLVWAVFAAIVVVLGFGPVRRALISRPLLGWIRSVLPQMSETERVAIEAGTVQKLAGFGEKTAAKILEGIDFLARSAGRTPLGIAVEIAGELRDVVAGFEGVKQVVCTGSLRRGRAASVVGPGAAG